MWGWGGGWCCVGGFFSLIRTPVCLPTHPPPPPKNSPAQSKKSAPRHPHTPTRTCRWPARRRNPSWGCPSTSRAAPSTAPSPPPSTLHTRRRRLLPPPLPTRRRRRRPPTQLQTRTRTRTRPAAPLTPLRRPSAPPPLLFLLLLLPPVRPLVYRPRVRARSGPRAARRPALLGLLPPAAAAPRRPRPIPAVSF